MHRVVGVGDRVLPVRVGRGVADTVIPAFVGRLVDSIIYERPDARIPRHPEAEVAVLVVAEAADGRKLVGFGGCPAPDVERPGRFVRFRIGQRLHIARLVESDCIRPKAAFFLPSSERYVASTSVGIATRPGRPLPGQDLHLLEQQTFYGAPGLGHWTGTLTGDNAHTIRREIQENGLPLGFSEFRNLHANHLDICFPLFVGEVIEVDDLRDRPIAHFDLEFVEWFILAIFTPNLQHFSLPPHLGRVNCIVNLFRYRVFCA